MGHIGLTPQSATMLGGFKAQGRTRREGASQLLDDALALEAAGCFAIVLEAVPAPVAAADHRASSRSRRSGSARAPDCDGQVLVWHDLLGLYDGHAPRVRQALRGARRRDHERARGVRGDVREGRFPEEQHTYSMPDEELAEFEAAIGAMLPVI